MGCSLETVPIAGLTKLFFDILFLQNDFPPPHFLENYFCRGKNKKVKNDHKSFLREN